MINKALKCTCCNCPIHGDKANTINLEMENLERWCVDNGKRLITYRKLIWERDVAEYLGFTQKNVQNYRLFEELEVFKVGGQGRNYYSLNDIAEWVICAYLH